MAPKSKEGLLRWRWGRVGEILEPMKLASLFRPPPLDPKLKTVGTASIFQNCTRPELETLKLYLHERHYLAGEIVFDEGEEGEGVYIVVSGKFRATRKGMLKKRNLGEILPGECFGEIALLKSTPRLATVVAEEPSVAFAMFRSDLERLADARPRLGFKVAVQVA
ncbi:MAG: cyclic nucleotide-binding domain-containing protein, partial [Verrucomicrobia bacterium]|nr:cyclic nucleotide-binding domain-containing protein [Verrucomicrobiota bacterium]